VETLGTKSVYANRWMSLREDAVRRADGSTGTYTVVDAPDIALIVPLDGKRLHLVEQYRHPLATRGWEFPSGTMDDDADAEALAVRELHEETGLRATGLTSLGTLDVAPSTISQRCHVFLATELIPGTPRRDPEEQDMCSAWFDLSAVQRMIAAGTITDAKTVAAFALFSMRPTANRTSP
jgi:8-oxo-dGTP pyrophosphatase MutT (NUDIX family)